MTDKERNTKIISIIMLVGIVYIVWGNVQYRNKIEVMETEIQQIEQKYVQFQQKIDSIETKQ